MLSHFQNPLAGDIAAASHVFQKGKNVVRTLRAAERDDEQCVVGQSLQFSFFSVQLSVPKTEH